MGSTEYIPGITEEERAACIIFAKTKQHKRIRFFPCAKKYNSTRRNSFSFHV